MNIIKHGKMYYEDTKYIITCEKCDCVYEINKSEILKGITYRDIAYLKEIMTYYSLCPECGDTSILKFTRDDIISFVCR